MLRQSSLARLYLTENSLVFDLLVLSQEKSLAQDYGKHPISLEGEKYLATRSIVHTDYEWIDMMDVAASGPGGPRPSP
jgi:hypothetical protein